MDDWGSELVLELLDPPRLDGAPFASWVFARIASLAGFEPPPDSPVVEVIDDAVYVLDWVVTTLDGTTVAKLQVQGGMVGVGLLGVQRRELGTSVVDALLAAMIERPLDVSRSKVLVRDPDWEEAPDDYLPRPDGRHANAFGWDGHSYLGVENVIPRP